MSVKAMSLVWDLPCHVDINGTEFKPAHKYVLLAYADHADHHGKNIYPAVKTIAKKTGYEERNIQLVTRKLEQMGLLVSDGLGRYGTKRWHIPFSEGGEKIAPLQSLQGEKDKIDSGANALGANALGANPAPELKEQNLSNNISIKYTDVWGRVLKTLQDELPRAQFETWIESTELVGFQDGTLIVGARNEYARDWLINRIAERAQEISGYLVKFVVAEMAEVEE